MSIFGHSWCPKMDKREIKPQGYWTRSMMDPEQAPGPETSSVLNSILFSCWNYLTTYFLPLKI